MNCQTCKFWKEIPREIGDQSEAAGKCKWGPPVRVGPKMAAWPTTPASEFCFRWEDKEFPRPATPEEQTRIDRATAHRTDAGLANDPNAVARQAAGQVAAAPDLSGTAAAESMLPKTEAGKAAIAEPTTPAPMFDSEIHKLVKPDKKK